MKAARRDHWRDVFAGLLADFADEGGTPMEAAGLFAEALHSKVSESVRAAALNALGVFETSSRPRRRR